MAVVFPLEKSGQVALVTAPAVLSVLSIVAVVLRVIARRMANRALDWSDYTIIVACVLSVTFSGVIMSEGIVGGGGWHVAEITERFGPEPIVLFLKISVGVQILWTLSLSLCKISILLLYCRIFALPVFQGCCYATGALIAAWSLSTILAALLICRPVSDLWAAVPEGHCGNHVLSYTVTGAINIVTDVVVLLLPLPYLARLEMALYKKVVLVATFTLGIFVCVISALRLRAIRTIDFHDITYSVAQAQVWSALEPALAITLACVPVLRPLFGGAHSATGTALGMGGGGGGGGYDHRRPKSRRGLLSPAAAAADSTTPGKLSLPPLGLPEDDDDGDDGTGSEYRLRPYYGPRHNVAISTHSVEISTYAAEMERRGRRQSPRADDPAAGGGIGVRREWDINSEH